MKLQTLEDFYGSFFDNMIDGLAYCQVIFDGQENLIDFIFVKINKNFEKLTGLKEIVGKKATEIIPKVNTSNPELFEVYSRVSLTGEPEKIETFIEPIAKWFSVSVYRPKKEFILGIFQNITSRKEIEKNLEDAKIAARNVFEDLRTEKLKVEIARAKEKAVLMSIGDGILATDEKGNLTLINKVAEKLLGKKSEEIIGKVLSEVIFIENEKGVSIPLEKRPISMALATSYTTNKTLADPAYYYIQKDKTKFPVAIMATPVILNGKIIGAIEVFRDITREKEIDKAKTEFVSLASHQLRTPLSTINWYAEMLITGDTGQLNEEQKKFLKEIYKSNQKMVKLVNTLLNVSRIELGTFVVEPEPTNLKNLAESIFSELAHQIQEKKLAITKKYDPTLPEVNVDPKLMQMVFQNILTNAVKYTPDKGKITIEIIKEKDEYKIIVTDTGYGIPKNAQNKIFTKLFRADNVREKDTEGTGLGLYIVKSIIDNIGGEISFNSKEDKGTVFEITMPLSGMRSKKGTKYLS